MPAFLAVTNTQTTNDRLIATNCERVVTARLRDARFFWDADRQVGLEARLERLDTVLFHKQLGSYRAKAARIERLAMWIASEVLGQPAQAEAAGRAGRLAKADLATQMVREFTELQGTMGGIYAREAGEPEAVWKAIYYHYLPIAVEANAPPSPEALGAARVTWAAVSLADKLDTLVGLFMTGERPTGSRDPFGLRRQAHGILRILLDGEALTSQAIRHPLSSLVRQTCANYNDTPADAPSGGLQADFDAVWSDLSAFLQERLQFVLESRGGDRRNVRAVLAARSDDGTVPVVEAFDNVRALPEFTASEQFQQLATAFKRVRNIAREHDDAAPAGDLRTTLREPAELALLDELERRQPLIERAIREARDFKQAYGEASKFEPAVARFFNEVFVMTDDPPLRAARLRLMKRLEQLILQLGDISEIVAES
jgi:glycyl-tRNA synthetase beta chain